MANLAGASGVCSYNGVSFLTLYKSSVSSRPILDEAERTTVYVEHTLTVEGYVAALTTDATLGTMRKALTACGGALTYTGKGFNPLVVNVGAVRDVKWGPIPEILEWKPLGGDCNAAEVTWRVVTRIPECDTAHYQGQLLAFNFEVTFDLDESGYTIVRVSGYAEIPMTRSAQGSRALPDHIDRYRPLLTFPVAPGFQRKTQSYTDSLDKRRCNFQIVDEEAPAALPDGTTKIEARHTLESQLLHEAFRIWTTTVDATITLARGLPKTEAMAVFLLLLQSRVRRQIVPLAPNTQSLQRITFEDDVFGRTARLAAVFRGFYAYTIDQAVNASNIWRPIAGTDYARWQASLGPTNTTGARGWAGIDNGPGSDAIVDLCLTGGSTTLYPEPPEKGSKKPGDKPVVPLTATKLSNVPKDSSWVTYRPKILWAEKTGVVRHKPLPPPPPPSGGDIGRVIRTPQPLTATKLTGVPATGDDATITNTQTAPTAADTSGGYGSDVFQRAASPTRTLIFSGRAVRIGFRIPVPKIDSVGGVPTVELSRRIVEAEPAAIGDVLLFALAWEIEYAVGSAPAGPLPYPANPVYGTDGGNGTTSALTGTP